MATNSSTASDVAFGVVVLAAAGGVLWFLSTLSPPETGGVAGPVSEAKMRKIVTELRDGGIEKVAAKKIGGEWYVSVPPSDADLGRYYIRRAGLGA